jgi:hypothetical protein
MSVAISGKFWTHHWMPYVYFASLGTALVLFSPPSFTKSHCANILPIFFFILNIMVTVRPANNAVRLLYGQPPPPPKHGRVDEIAAYLNKHLSPSDKVQSLDWIGGTTHAMLLSKAVVATPYVTDFQFYHHVSNPYIQKLRKHFLAGLKQEMPAFIIHMDAKPRVSGLDTSYSFPELESFIKRNYRKDYTGNGFEIFRRNNN